MCDVCRGDDNEYFIFVCLLCDFMVHRRCIYLPQVIKISRHKHRLSFAFSLSFGEIMACGVCRKIIAENYGVYTCLRNDCIYGVHTQCATSGLLLGAIWDGKELEGEPEEEDEESIKPSFEEISNGIILHFSHPEHPMRLDEDIKLWHDGEKYCQACIAPLYDGKAYICMKCDYVLHEECACLPRVKQHAFHAHLLHLEPCRNQIRTCQCCWVKSCGFKYVCYNTNIHDCDGFVLDVRCASISEPYNHHPHRHPLFFNSSRGGCSICQGSLTISLTCDECRLFLCLGCATFPYKVRYKNHEHLLTFSYKELNFGDEYWFGNTDGVYSCDLCEEAIVPSRFYRCEECEVALHIECLLGKDLYMNPGSRFTLCNGKEFNIVENNALTRPICTGCGKRCKYRMMFIVSPSGDIYCSTKHFYSEDDQRAELIQQKEKREQGHVN
ncbi:PREDICTED: uncharacterized protein LOC104768502 [Camelina sativa]|uniref:Uncharacterized protein LOC104768502 n=1 Tax=Camelina sativa TaxID=90675 RepID=A0ABM0XTG2_CAMSA|nr:PREDICTED: uncharacterized protein LOC104768502 [Camelina sativa]